MFKYFGGYVIQSAEKGCSRYLLNSINDVAGLALHPLFGKMALSLKS